MKYLVVLAILCLNSFCGCQRQSISLIKEPRLEILPSQPVQRRPISRPLILTCSPNVEQKDLITDLKWKDSFNNTIYPKQYGSQPIIYTETLQVNQLMLVITSMSESLAGYYYCSASYAHSEYIEEKVKIETYTAITWKDAPEYQTTNIGVDYVIRCIVTANPPPSVDWLRNGDQIKSSEKFIIKHDGLLVKSVQESDDGIYTCRAAVIQTGELMERNIRLEVHIKPTIEMLNVVYEAIDGEEFSAKCVATGKPPPLVQWIKDQRDMSLADRFSVVPHNGQMSITRVEAEHDRGIYTCIAKNDAGIAEKETRLNVVEKPKIFELKNITVPISNETMLICKSKGWPIPHVTFRRWRSEDELRLGHQENDDRIILEQTVDNELGEATGIMMISNTVRADDGLYQCVARNKGGTALEVGHITIEYPPNFDHMKELPPVFSWEQRKANLSCMAMALPNATIEWRWNERLIREMQDKFLQIVEDGPRSDLIVEPADRRYYSAFKCIAVNKIGRAEHIMELREAHLPTAVAQAKPIEVTATTITFDIVGPPFELGMPIKAYTAQYKEERNPDWSYSINRTWSPDTPYVVEGLRPQTMYTFRFAARNDVGLGQWSAIRVQATPSRSTPETPKILNQFAQDGTEEGELPIITSLFADRFELIWQRPPDNGEPIDFYAIKYCPGSKINNNWNENSRMCNEQSYIAYTFSNFVLKKLIPDTYYKLELRAHNAIGFSAPTYAYLKTSRGADSELMGEIERIEEQQFHLSSISIILLAVLGVVLLLILIDVTCCITKDLGIFALIFSRKAHSTTTRRRFDRQNEKSELITVFRQHQQQQQQPTSQQHYANDGIGKNSSV